MRLITQAYEVSAVINPDRLILITILHGTFARDASWPSADSVFRRSISEELGPDSQQVVFDHFRWSGLNTHRARFRAGRELASHLRELYRKNAGADKFIVAHSHGGNVALFSHQHLSLDQHCDGLVTLGTPFIVARKSLLERNIRWIRLRAALAAIVLFLCSLILMYISGAFSLLRFSPAAPIVLIIIVAFAWFVFYIHISDKAWKWWRYLTGERTALRLLKGMKPSRLTNSQMLVVNYYGDEAEHFLKALSATSIIPNRLISTLVTVLWCSVISLVASFWLLRIMHLLGVNVRPVGDLLYDIAIETGGLYYYFVILIAGILSLYTIRILLSLLRGNPLGFGWESPFVNGLLDITVKWSPTVNAKSCTVIRPRIEARAANHLKHCYYYDDCELLTEIGKWMLSVRQDKHSLPG